MIENGLGFVEEGNKLGELGKYDEAFKCFDKATKLDPEDADAWGCKGEVESELGQECEGKVRGGGTVLDRNLGPRK